MTQFWNHWILFKKFIIYAFLLKYKKLSLLLFLLATVGILVGTLFPSDKITVVRIWDYDKIGHFIMFAVWTFLYGVVRAIRIDEAPNLISVFILGLTYGVIVEVLQFILPTNRSPELLDFIADALGSGFAILLLRPLFKKYFNSDS